MAGFEVTTEEIVSDSLIEAVKLAALLFGEDAVAAEGRQQTGHQGRIVT
jgi:hypothetical protein